MAITDDVLEIMQLGRGRLNDLTDQQVRDLTAAWVDAWDDLQGEVDALVTGMVTKAGPNGVVKLASVQRDRREPRARSCRERVGALGPACGTFQ